MQWGKWDMEQLGSRIPKDAKNLLVFNEVGQQAGLHTALCSPSCLRYHHSFQLLNTTALACQVLKLYKHTCLDRLQLHSHTPHPLPLLQPNHRMQAAMLPTEAAVSLAAHPAASTTLHASLNTPCIPAALLPLHSPHTLPQLNGTARVPHCRRSGPSWRLSPTPRGCA